MGGEKLLKEEYCRKIECEYEDKSFKGGLTWHGSVRGVGRESCPSPELFEGNSDFVWSATGINRD